jgi:hypothetical protein
MWMFHVDLAIKHYRSSMTAYVIDFQMKPDTVVDWVIPTFGDEAKDWFIATTQISIG